MLRIIEFNRDECSDPAVRSSLQNFSQLTHLFIMMVSLALLRYILPMKVLSELTFLQFKMGGSTEALNLEFVDEINVSFAGALKDFVFLCDPLVSNIIEASSS